MPNVANFVWEKLEEDYPYKTFESVKSRDAVVVLSGMLQGFWLGEKYVAEWGDPDRYFAGLKIFQSGKADYIIFTGGKLPWSDKPPESEVLKKQAIMDGIEPDRVLTTGIAANTAEEANQVKKIVEKHSFDSVILVTSSFHMPRAKILFESEGVKVHPYATDFRSKNDQLKLLGFIPNSNALSRTSLGLREFIGRSYYHFILASM